jgi:non-specific serine/threonine protein kinase/serine/threonine-protein kinase
MEETRQWERVKELFEAGLNCDPDKRGDFLRDACGSDDSLRAEVESLLEAYAASDGLSLGAWESDLADDLKTPDWIGPYHLIKKIGEGGMGQVWLAEQTAPLHRQVALKLLRTAAFDEALLLRFQSERQSLAIMDHPAIAKVFDAGATPTGQPYFVMEYVPGEPITEYCDQRKLTIPERLQLFVRVCEGVQHAHQKAVIHRDLKPANILVVELDAKPTPRIIDFGLAKATTPPLPEEANSTRAGGFVGTLGYMSPEQADSRIGDIDTRTDVYSLGVILYELLTGLPPFDNKEWQKAPIDEVLRQLRERDAPLPSTRVGTVKAVSEFRRTDPRRLKSELHGDLDWITMKALEKDRGRRYGTVSELAADITRHMNNQPVAARSATASYRLHKYLLRHRIAVSVGAGSILLLAAFAVVEAIQLHRIKLERDRASRVTAFMTAMFRVSDPGQARGNSITAREILDKASNDINTGLAKDPELQAQMMFVMGKVYDQLGLYPRAEALLRQSAATRQRVLGDKNPETLESNIALAWTLDHEGRYAEAEKLQRQALEAGRDFFGTESAESLLAMQGLGWSLYEEGRYNEAEKLQREAIDGQRQILGPDNADTLRTMDQMASTLREEGHRGNAEQLYRQVLEARMRLLGPEHLDTIMTMNNLAGVLVYEGKNAEGEKLFRQVLDVRRRVLGPEHPDTLETMNNLAITLKREGHLADAEALQEQTLDINRRVLGPEHPKTLLMMNNLGETWAEMGKYQDAEKLIEEARAIQLRVLPPDAPTTAISTYNLAGIAAREGRRDFALDTVREAVDHGLPPLVDISIDQDPDLNSLHGDPRFDALVAHAKERAAAAHRK